MNLSIIFLKIPTYEWFNNGRLTSHRIEVIEINPVKEEIVAIILKSGLRF